MYNIKSNEEKIKDLAIQLADNPTSKLAIHNLVSLLKRLNLLSVTDEVYSNKSDIEIYQDKFRESGIPDIQYVQLSCDIILVYSKLGYHFVKTNGLKRRKKFTPEIFTSYEELDPTTHLFIPAHISAFYSNIKIVVETTKISISPCYILDYNILSILQIDPSPIPLMIEGRGALSIIENTIFKNPEGQLLYNDITNGYCPHGRYVDHTKNKLMIPLEIADTYKVCSIDEYSIPICRGGESYNRTLRPILYSDLSTISTAHINRPLVFSLQVGISRLSYPDIIDTKITCDSFREFLNGFKEFLKVKFPNMGIVANENPTNTYEIDLIYLYRLDDKISHQEINNYIRKVYLPVLSR